MEDFTSQDYFEKLYKKAEKWLSETGEGANTTLPSSVMMLLQELSIHRVELEMQNEELRNLQSYVETNRNKYKEFFELAPMGYVETDIHGRVTEVNRTFCRLVNYDKNTILQLPFVFFIAAGDKNKYYSHLNKVIGKENRDSCELKLFRKHGVQQNVLLQSVCIKNGNDKRCFTAIIEFPESATSESPGYNGNQDKVLPGEYPADNEKDLTEKELKKTLAELEHTNKELEEFTSIISHDLQEPVRMVEKLSLLLLQRYKGKLDPQGEELTQIIVDGAVRMRELVKDLLNLSRVTTKGKPFEWINTEGILQSILIETLSYQLEETNAVITHDPMPDIFADKVQFEHLLQNLISNAIKYHKPGIKPEVHISCQVKKDEWLFSVKDNGIGIAREFHERIFRIFQRLHLPSEYEGSGVGLTLCQKIIDRHRGHIWVESEEGKGAAFFFTIPKPF